MTCPCHGSQFDVTSGAVFGDRHSGPHVSVLCRSRATTSWLNREIRLNAWNPIRLWLEWRTYVRR